MNKAYFALAVCAFVVIGHKPAAAFCSEPSAPSAFSRPTKPDAPFCVNEWNRTHTCDDWQITSYNNDLEAYQDDLRDYVDRLRRYVEEAVAYAECEIRNLD